MSLFFNDSEKISFFKENVEGIDIKSWEDMEEAILSLEVMPSMRALMTAGKALERENIAGYNCSYIPIDNPKAFDTLSELVLLN